MVFIVTAALTATALLSVHPFDKLAAFIGLIINLGGFAIEAFKYGRGDGQSSGLNMSCLLIDPNIGLFDFLAGIVIMVLVRWSQQQPYPFDPSCGWGVGERRTNILRSIILLCGSHHFCPASSQVCCCGSWCSEKFGFSALCQFACRLLYLTESLKVLSILFFEWSLV